MYFEIWYHVEMKGYFISLKDGLQLPQAFLQMLRYIYAHI